jgi:hypothetical protein
VPTSPPPAPIPPPGAERAVGYVRGGGVELDRRKAGRVVAILGIVLLAGLTVGFGVNGIVKVNRDDRLTNHGVPVTVRVTKCVAIASGTGATYTGFQCRGRFILDGRSQVEVIGGTTTPHPVGSLVSAVADPSDPSVLATATSVAATPPAWHRFVAAAICALVLVGLLASLLVRRRRSQAQPPSFSSQDHA